LEIKGSQLTRDLLKGTEIDLTFEGSESRDFTVSAYLDGTGQEFSQVFNGTNRNTPTKTLSREVVILEEKIQNEIDEAIANDNQDAVKGLERLLERAQDLIVVSANLNADDVTDDRFKIEDQKRKIAQDLFELTASKRLDVARNEYQNEKSKIASLVNEKGNDREKHMLRDLIAKEPTFLTSINPDRIEAATSELGRIKWGILSRSPDFLMSMFDHLVNNRTSMNDQSLANELINSGRRHIDNEKWDDLRHINSRLWDLMPTSVQEANDMRLYTNIILS
jgi:molecular chaperone DnaK